MSFAAKLMLLALPAYLLPLGANATQQNTFAVCNETPELRCVNYADPMISHFGGMADMMQRMSFLREVRSEEDKIFKGELSEIDRKIACVRFPNACDKKTKSEIAALKEKIKKAYPDFRIAAALFDPPTNFKEARMETLRRANDPDKAVPLFLRGPGVSAMFSGLPSHTLTPEEMNEADALFYKNFSAILASYERERDRADGTLKKLLEQAGNDGLKEAIAKDNHRNAYLQKHLQEMKDFYRRRYTDHISQLRILAYFEGDPDSDEALTKALLGMKRNIEDFRAYSVPKDSDYIGNLEGLVLSRESVEKVLQKVKTERPQDLQNLCIYADVTYNSAVNSKFYMDQVKKWGPWALSATCGIAATVTAPVLWPWCLRAGISAWGAGIVAEAYDLPQRTRNSFVKVEVEGKTVDLDELYDAKKRNNYDLLMLASAGATLARIVPNMTYIDTSKIVRQLLEKTPKLKKSEVAVGVTEVLASGVLNSVLNRGVHGQVKTQIVENGKIKLSLEDHADYVSYHASLNAPPSKHAQVVTLDFNAEIEHEYCQIKKKAKDCP